MLLGLISRRAAAPAVDLEMLSDPAYRSDPRDARSRTRLINEIIAANPSATLEFLRIFSTEDLEEYIAHLHANADPRGRNARWVRPNVARGIECYPPRDDAFHGVRTGVAVFSRLPPPPRPPFAPASRVAEQRASDPTKQTKPLSRALAASTGCGRLVGAEVAIFADASGPRPPVSPLNSRTCWVPG